MGHQTPSVNIGDFALAGYAPFQKQGNAHIGRCLFCGSKLTVIDYAKGATVSCNGRCDSNRIIQDVAAKSATAKAKQTTITVDTDRKAERDDFIKQTAQAALFNADTVLPALAPDGRREGDEYVLLNPNRNDKKKGNFKVNMRTGLWSDFAIGKNGGDLVSLTAYLRQTKTQLEAANFLAEITRSPKFGSVTNQDNVVPLPPPKAALKPVPTRTAPSEEQLKRKGIAPSAFWTYHNADGTIATVARRFDKEGGDKDYLPLTYGEIDGRVDWHMLAIPNNRPLFRLREIIGADDSMMIVITEGEKTANAAQRLLPHHIATTWFGGSQAIGKTDFSPLARKTVALCPDNDEPGKKAMEKLTKILQQLGCKIKVLDLSVFGNIPSGWDLADENNLTSADLADLERNGTLWIEQATDHTSQLTAKAPPGFTVTKERGVVYAADVEGEIKTTVVCSYLAILAQTRDNESKNWGWLIEYSDPDNRLHTAILPRTVLTNDGDLVRTLHSFGVDLAPSKAARALLRQYFSQAANTERATIVERTGWHGTCFVLPSSTIGEASERVLLMGEDTAAGLKQKGSLDDWKELARLCARSSRAVFAICISFMAPLQHKVGSESGGFHFYGSSSQGKTISLLAAASVFGSHEYVSTWRATTNGLEASAAAHSDLPQILDEIGQAEPEQVANFIYTLSQEQGKQRATQTGGSAKKKTWRTTVLSSGELKHSEYIRSAGKRSFAGHEVRFGDIAADAGKGFGIFERISGCLSAKALADALKTATASFYGTAGPAFIKRLTETENIEQRVKQLMADFKKAECIKQVTSSSPDGQVHRALDRFALVAAAGELATELGITGWHKGVAFWSAARCFQSWLQQRGTVGALEEQQILKQVQHFFEKHGQSRFALLDNYDQSEKADVRDCAGFKKDTGDDFVYRVFPETFEKEIAKGFHLKLVKEVLKQKGWLIPNKEGHATTKCHLPGTHQKKAPFYVISSNVFDTTDE